MNTEAEGVDARLRQVADILVRHPLRLPGAQPIKPSSVDDVGRKAVALVKGLGSLVVEFARAGRDAIVDNDEARMLYQDATGATVDRANADLDVVRERLLHLANGWSSDLEPLARVAAERLLVWTANGRPVSSTIQETEQAYGRVIRFLETRPKRNWLAGYGPAQEEYQQAWRRALGWSEGQIREHGDQT